MTIEAYEDRLRRVQSEFDGVARVCQEKTDAYKEACEALDTVGERLKQAQDELAAERRRIEGGC